MQGVESNDSAFAKSLKPPIEKPAGDGTSPFGAGMFVVQPVALVAHFACQQLAES